ncbi:NIPSNAP family protein [Actibacterium sp.]|uniref:NIPSNAP family protein n=1 Tax=Actibacterium sp. TaxID=1872125 RepID=UPI003563AC17
MLYELRAYDLMPDKGPAYLDLFRKNGVQFVTRHLPMLGYWLTDTGALNRLYHLWAYKSLDERLACRAGLAGDADWNDGFMPKGFPLIVSQRNMMMQLETSSEMLDRATAARKTVHPGQDDATPMFTPAYLSLTMEGDVVPGVELLGRWRVVSGEQPGQIVTLYRHETDDPMATATGAARHELLRAITCSPLR